MTTPSSNFLYGSESIIIYETEGDFRTTETSGRYRELVGMVASVLVPGSFGRQGYEVSSRIEL